MSQVNPAAGAAPGVTIRKDTPGATSVYGAPLAIVFGTFRIAPTIILSGIHLIASSYGGGISVETVQFALCEGEIVSVLAYWREKVRTVGTTGLTVATGTLPQAPWASLVGALAPFALGYGGVATISCLTGFHTVSTGELERSTYEVRGLLSTQQDGASSAYDARAWEILEGILTSGIYGLSWSPSQLGDQSAGDPFQLGAGGTADSGYARCCDANGWHISLAITEQRSARDILEEVLVATDAVALWSEGALKFRPMGERTVSGSVTFTPYLAPLYDLGATGAGNDFADGPGSPLVTVERAKRADVYNCHPVEWSNRFPARKDTTGATISEPFNSYNADVEDGIPDPTDVASFGLRKASTTSLRCITRADHAKAIAEALTTRALYTSRCRYRFRLGWRFALLEPTDLVTITDAVLGISRRLVRIAEIEEQEDGTFDVVAYGVETIPTAAAAVYSVT